MNRQRDLRVLVLALVVLFGRAAPAVGQERRGDPELRPPPQLDDGWESASLEDVGIAPDPIRELLAEIRSGTFPDIHSVLIARQGRLVLDAYFPGYAWDYEGEAFRGPWTEFGPETLHNLASVTKSVTGLLAGIAIDRGDLPGLDANVFSFFPEYSRLSDEGKAGITLRHLLTMTSGLQWNEQDVFYSEIENDIVQLFVVSDPVEHVLSKELAHPPGSQWYYNGGGTNLFGEIIQRSSGDRLDVFAQKHLFSPLQITGAEWIFIQPDFVYASGDMKLRSRDLAKLGQLVLNGGMWRGTRIVSEEWVQEMTRTQVPLGPSQGYGYHWWTRDYTCESGAINAFLADGWGGQRVMGFPSLDLVVVFTGGNYTQQHRLDEIVTGYILPAIAESR